jgi:hypothetical protein
MDCISVERCRRRPYWRPRASTHRKQRFVNALPVTVSSSRVAGIQTSLPVLLDRVSSGNRRASGRLERFRHRDMNKTVT